MRTVSRRNATCQPASPGPGRSGSGAGCAHRMTEEDARAVDARYGVAAEDVTLDRVRQPLRTAVGGFGGALRDVLAHELAATEGAEHGAVDMAAADHPGRRRAGEVDAPR